MQFNNFRFNPIGLGLEEETINGHFVFPHSNENIGSVSSQFLANNPTIGLHQRSQHGQVGLSQRVTEIRRSYVTPHRVQVHTQIDYFPMQNHPLSEVSVTEVVRTRFLTPTPTREKFFVPTSSRENGFAPTSSRENVFVPNIQGQRPNSQNQSVYTGNVPFHGRFNQNPAQNHQALNLNLGLADHNEPKREGILSPEPINVFAPEAKQNLPNNHDQLGVNFQNLSMNESSSNQTSSNDLVNPLRAPTSERVPSSARVPSPINVQNDHDDDHEDYDVEDDGRTHSLPTKKNGPYTCPKCRRVFNTSQAFAAHIGSHYKNESREERKKRQAARYKKKSFRLSKSRDGLTLMPASFKNAYGKIREKKVPKQEQAVRGVASNAGVKIKEEPM